MNSKIYNYNKQLLFCAQVLMISLCVDTWIHIGIKNIVTYSTNDYYMLISF